MAEHFPALGIRVAGIVVNRVDPESGKDYYSYEYGQAYQYGYAYGHDDDSEEEDGRPQRTAASKQIVRRLHHGKDLLAHLLHGESGQGMSTDVAQREGTQG